MLINYLNTLPPEVTSLCMLLTCGGFILLCHQRFGLNGLFLYLSVAPICGNIQVLKAVKLSVFPEPVALGTIIFTSTYLCTNIIQEHYGIKAARRGIWLSFMAMIMMMAIMTLSLGWMPFETQDSSALGRFSRAHEAMQIIFTPAPALVLASLSAFILSHYSDTWLYRLLKTSTQGRCLWLRSWCAMTLSALIDNSVFSILAWVIFAPFPIDTHTLVYTYILGTFFLRVGLSVLNTPFLYLSSLYTPRETTNAIV